MPTYTFDRSGRPAPDPWAVLGLSPGASTEAIRAAYLERVVAHPPETDPDRFRVVNAAYRLLTEPGSVLDRHLGRLSVPDPAAHDLAEPDAGGERTPRELLAGELLLYALAEALAPRP